MPGVNIIFSSELKCDDCGEVLGRSGEYATLCSKDGAVFLVNDADPPTGLKVTLECKSGHQTKPRDCSLEYWFTAKKNARTASGRAIARL